MFSAYQFRPGVDFTLTADETWAGAIAIAYKALDPRCPVWSNDASLSSDSGVDTPERWRIWM